MDGVEAVERSNSARLFTPAVCGNIAKCKVVFHYVMDVRRSSLLCTCATPVAADRPPAVSLYNLTRFLFGNARYEYD